MDARLDQNQAEFGVDILTVTLKMLADGHGFLDQEIEILRDVWLESNCFHDSQNLIAINKTHLSYSMGVTENDS